MGGQLGASMKFLLSLSIFAAQSCAEVNLLTFVNGDKGFNLGSAFGAPGTNATYDYIVVGGGTGGLALATRLAEDRGISVAVVEAGGFYETDNGNKSIVPGYSNFYTGSDPNNWQPLIDWGFVTEPQAGGAQRRMHYARGKTLGGSSARNYMIYHRPTKGSMDKWADEVGDDSYTWDNMFPWFKKSCNFTSFNRALYNATLQDHDPSLYDSNGGPLHTSFSNYADAFGSWAQKGFVGVGMQEQNSLNGGVLNGSAFSTLTIDPRNGFRSSSESSFLQAALSNGTAPTIYKYTLAKKILFDSNKTANGVLVSTQGAEGTGPVNFTLSANKEVIISAGAFQSPQLLMVSGIGPQQTLKENNIPVLKDSPGVGQNMWDHILYGVSYRVNVKTSSAGLNSPIVAGALADQFLKNGSGPLAAFGAGVYGWEDIPEPYRSAVGQDNLDRIRADVSPDWPELEWLPISAFLGYQTNRQTADPRDGYNYATMNPGIIAPLSRGNITINSSDTADHPIINPNWLTDPADQKLAIQAFKRSRQIWDFLSQQNLTIGDEYFPGKNTTSDSDILDFISRSFMTIYHAAATCKMGRSNDSMAVIDPHARVYGVQNLRVVDASSFPFLPPGHPQSVVYALAEKIAQDILSPMGVTTDPGYSLAGYTSNEQVSLAQNSANGGGPEGSKGAAATLGAKSFWVTVGLVGVMSVVGMWL